VVVAKWWAKLDHYVMDPSSSLDAPFVGAQVVSWNFFVCVLESATCFGASTFGGWGFPLTWLQEVGGLWWSFSREIRVLKTRWSYDDLFLQKTNCKHLPTWVNHGRCCCWLNETKRSSQLWPSPISPSLDILVIPPKDQYQLEMEHFHWQSINGNTPSLWDGGYIYSLVGWHLLSCIGK
jgi:hypothetical protein